MRKPNFIIIGAQKAGTTWLWQNVRKHPQIFVPDNKELTYFNRPNFVNTDTFNNVYLPYFADAQPEQLLGEATPGYFWSMDTQSKWCVPPHAYTENIPQVIHDYLGDDVKFLLSLRNPVRRAISAFYHHYRVTKAIASHDTILGRGDYNGIIDMGFYHRHLTHWLAVYPPENFLILHFTKDIQDGPEQTMQRVFEFLDVPPIELPNLKQRAYKGFELSVSDDQQRLAPTDTAPDLPVVHRHEIESIQSLFEADIRQLGNSLGWDVTDWLNSADNIFYNH